MREAGLSDPRRLSALARFGCSPTHPGTSAIWALRSWAVGLDIKGSGPSIAVFPGRLMQGNAPPGSSGWGMVGAVGRRCGGGWSGTRSGCSPSPSSSSNRLAKIGAVKLRSSSLRAERDGSRRQVTCRHSWSAAHRHATWQTTAKARLDLAVRLGPARCTVVQLWTDASPTLSGQLTAASAP